MKDSTTLDSTVFSVIRDYISLTKPRINSLVLVTTYVGMYTAGSAIPYFGLTILTLIGVAFTVASASVFNCYQEKDIDSRMNRTKNRPLPAGRISMNRALNFGLILGVVGLVILYLKVNTISALLALSALVIYSPLYTKMKQFTSLATIVGAIPGALPPVIGWTAVNNSIGTPALILFFIMFFWQPPHFLALAIFRKEEYERAELAMLPVESNIKVALRQIVVYSSALLPLSLLPYPLGMAGRIYLGIALIGGILLLLMGIRGFFTGKTNRRRWAKRLFFYTIIYLTCLFCGLIFDYSI